MNVRKTIAGVAVTLGSTAVMLGLGGTAQAADAGAEIRPEIDTEPGKVATVGDLVRVDTEELAGHVSRFELDPDDPKSLARTLKGPVRDLLRETARHVPTVETGLSLGS
ncbi:hypothetical protein [Saccharothrix deserti]|uniref:hypothetical protein n=1 Tax=Saccharothrix deserti TaxID=2593674 RepID=UPI00131BC9DE|nr:hypothetical protein [Saccharothrix deserti]